VGCRHHLAVDVNERGNLKFTTPNVPVERMSETCSLDVADRGGASLSEMAEMLGLSYQRTHHLVKEAVASAFVAAAQLTEKGVISLPASLNQRHDGDEE